MNYDITKGEEIYYIDGWATGRSNRKFDSEQRINFTDNGTNSITYNLYIPNPCYTRRRYFSRHTDDSLSLSSTVDCFSYGGENTLYVINEEAAGPKKQD